MGNIIQVDFKARQLQKKAQLRPNKFYSGWVSASIPNKKTSFIKFKVYQTSKNYAVQFSIGEGTTYHDSPDFWYTESPLYRKDLDDLWTYIFNRLPHLNIKPSIITEKLSKSPL